MNEFLAHAEAFFLTPAAGAQPRAIARASDRAAVLAGADRLPAAAGALAAALRRRAKAPTAVVAIPGAPVASCPATPAARAAARRMTRRELPAVARGTLCFVALPPDQAATVRDGWRLLAAAGIPVVFALDRRDETTDGLLPELDLLAFAPPSTADASLTELAVASLERLGPPVHVLAPPTSPLTRRAAALGLVAADLRGAAAVTAE